MVYGEFANEDSAGVSLEARLRQHGQEQLGRRDGLGIVAAKRASTGAIFGALNETLECSRMFANIEGLTKCT